MDYSQNSTDELIAALKRNDEKAFKFIYLSYYHMLCAYILNLTHNKEEAEDIVQDILIKLWEKRQSITIHTSLKAYLYRATHNKFLDDYRSKKWKNEVLESIRYNTLQMVVTQEEPNGISKNQIDHLKKVIEELPPKCKEIFMLCKLQGRSYKDIAETLGISIKTVENQIGIAFKKIRKGFEKGHFILIFIRKLLRSG